MLSKELETVLNEAFRAARAHRQEFVTVEHLLLALLDDSVTLTILHACQVDIDALRNDLVEFIDSTTPLLGDKESDNRDIQPTLGFQRVLQRAVFHVQSSGKHEVTGADLLVAIFSEQESRAVYLLKIQNASRLEVVNFIAHGIGKSDATEGEQQRHAATDHHNEESNLDEHTATPLETYTTNLNEEAKLGRIDPLIGRSSEVERVTQIFARRRKNNPLLVGESGVGKTAIAEGLAKMIVDGVVPNVLKDAVVYSLDLGALLAGTKYRGDFEKRFKQLMADLKKKDNAILFIDEIHTIIGAGAASSGVMDASNLLKPLLGSTGKGKIRCLGSTTYTEYQGIFDKDRAFSRRFQKVDVLEPSIDDAYKILKGLKSRFEEHHGLRYSDKALWLAVEMAARYINDRYLPDKAIDVIDEAGARQQLLPTSKRKKVIGRTDIEAIIAKIVRIPPKTVASDERKLLEKLESNLQMTVFGQDKAAAELVSSIKLARAGLRPGDKPIGSFLLAGPTGVGKTEITKQLALQLGLELIRFDMSEYMERHTVSRLIGAPPGYVGFDQGGLLTDAVIKHPHSVVLLDEIEKAHPDVFNLLLQVMDHAILTDNNGRKADFRNVILVMTTNAGAENVSRRSIGFTQQDHGTDALEAINRMFTPEFRNRLDAVVLFEPLSEDVILTVLDKFLVELQGQLDEKQVQLEVDGEARLWLVEKGYDRTMGARPMARVIQEYVKKPLADMVLFGSLNKGGIAHISLNEDRSGLIVTAEIIKSLEAANA